MSIEVFVFSDAKSINCSATPSWVGTLRSTQTKNKEHFSFSYAPTWLASGDAQKIDPELELYAGEQHSPNQNFRSFLDSCPDRWGRLLMKRREAVHARQEGRRPKVLNEIDYLLGVHDLYRQGALRFKLKMDGPFLDDDQLRAAPPMSSLRELEHAAQQVETNKSDDAEYLKWLNMLMSPGSSLGGARPKASVTDENNDLWIAKFPSRYDDYNIAAWEFVAYRLALKAGIKMAPCKLEQFNSHHHTFLTKRFDRAGQSRLYFSSAMTQLGYYDGDYEASYLEIAQFLTEHGSNTKKDLEQLWRRIVFNIAVSNTDDHLRNHGFIFQGKGWALSPAYDVNPVTPAGGLHLNISDEDNSLDFELAMSVINFFQLSRQRAEEVLSEVNCSVKGWRHIASDIGINRQEQQLMEPAFNLQ